MSQRARSQALTCVAVALLCAAAGPACSRTSAAADAGCPTYGFVVDQITLPATKEDARDLSYDLDHNGTVDNALGLIVVKIAEALGEPLAQEIVDDALSSGRFILLLAIFLEGAILDSSIANLWWVQGAPLAPTQGPEPGGSYAPDLAHDPYRGLMGGRIRGGGLVFGGNSAAFSATVLLTPDVSLPLQLYALNGEADVSTDGETLENGRIGAAITYADFETKVLPVLVSVLDQRLHSECSSAGDPDGGIPGPCGVCTPLGEAVRGTFDVTGDCEITIEELHANPLVGDDLSHTDVTLEDGTTAFSVGLGFHAVSATFSVPRSVCPWFGAAG